MDLSTFFEISLSEEELHAHLHELRVVLEDVSLIELEVTLYIFSENEQLINFLLLHYKVLSGHHRQVRLI